MTMKKRDFKRYSSLILLGVCLCFSILIQGAVKYPSPTVYKYVNDYANVLDANSKNRIIALGQELEQKTGAQAVVVTVDSLNQVPIEDYANGLFRAWGIGRAQQDNGLLILLSMKEQEWRVEVGRGLEGAITDAGSNRIMQTLALPNFQINNYGQGILQAYSQLCDDIADEYNVVLTHSLHTNVVGNGQERGGFRVNPITYWVIIGILLIDIFFNRGRLLHLLFISSLFGGGPRGGGGGGYGGYGGGSSNGGGSSGGW